MMPTFFSNLFYLFTICLILVLIIIKTSDFHYNKSGPSERDQLLIIHKGQSVEKIASRLKELNLIENRFFFLLIVRLKGIHYQLKFGEYVIPKSASIKEIMERVVSGVSTQYSITIQEGLTSYSIINLINKDHRIKGDLIPIAAEGVLAPDTYSFDIATSKKDLIIKMKDKQKKIIKKAWHNRATDLPLKNASELLILASIVEREAGNEDDKKMVASVFLNRLKKKNEITI